MTTDQITIAIPVYNREDFFPVALESALNQTIRTKIIVVDNASDHDKFEKYVNELKDPRVKYYRNEENVGMVGNWNRCIELSNTPWISILHDDDALHKRFTEIMLKVIAKDQNLGMAGAKALVGESFPEDLNQNIDLTASGKYLNPAYFLYKNISPFPGVVFRKELGEKINGYNPEYHPIADLDFWYRISRLAPSVLIDKKLVWYRISPLQETFSKIQSILDVTVVIREKIQKELGLKGNILKASVNYEHQNLLKYYINTYHLENLYYEPSWYSKTTQRKRFIQYYIRKKSFQGDFNL